MNTSRRICRSSVERFRSVTETEEIRALSAKMDDLFHWTSDHHKLKEMVQHAKRGNPTVKESDGTTCDDQGVWETQNPVHDVEGTDSADGM